MNYTYVGLGIALLSIWYVLNPEDPRFVVDHDDEDDIQVFAY